MPSAHNLLATMTNSTKASTQQPHSLTCSNVQHPDFDSYPSPIPARSRPIRPLKMQVAWPVASQESRQLPVGFFLCFVVVFLSPFCCLGLFVGFLVCWFVGPPSLRFARLFRFYLTFLAFAPLIGRKYQKWQCMTTMFIMIIMLPHDHPHDPECHDQECLVYSTLPGPDV